METFNLYDYLSKILENFYNKNDLKHMCALESLMIHNYKNKDQLHFLERFIEIEKRVSDREYNQKPNIF